MSKLSKDEYKRWCMYRKCGGHALARLKVNQCSLSYGSTEHTKHEIRKYILCNDLHNLKHKFVTEAVPLNRPDVRHDVVDLTTGEVYEIVNTSLSKNLDGLEYKVIHI